MTIHPFAPVCDERARILILGSFPSVASRETGFYYGHPRNRFWQVLSAVLCRPAPGGIPEKEAMLHQNGIALWDVIAACEIEGSSDASIAQARPNDIAGLLARAPIARIYANGKTAGALYLRQVQPVTGRAICTLPSTSPANAAWSLPRLIEAWRVVAQPS